MGATISLPVKKEYGLNISNYWETKKENKRQSSKKEIYWIHLWHPTSTCSTRPSNVTVFMIFKSFSQLPSCSISQSTVLWVIFKYYLLLFFIDNYYHVPPYYYLCRVFKFLFHLISNTIILTAMWGRQIRNVFYYTDSKTATHIDYHGYQLIVPRQDSKAFYSSFGLPPLHVVTTGLHTWHIAIAAWSSYITILSPLKSLLVAVNYSEASIFSWWFSAQQSAKASYCYPQSQVFKTLNRINTVSFNENIFLRLLYCTKQNFHNSQLGLLTGSSKRLF